MEEEAGAARGRHGVLAVVGSEAVGVVVEGEQCLRHTLAVSESEAVEVAVGQVHTVLQSFRLRWLMPACWQRHRGPSAAQMIVASQGTSVVQRARFLAPDPRIDRALHLPVLQCPCLDD